eukprot:GHRQ01007944.1.p1 GENE.GHRQ01007944.1~~GHRQ01007944.1.p1  ORF type:complete len:283 (+),score=117.56 GHRQ01007944.1:886-1734(+)
MAAANDEDYALQLHKQLNAVPLRARRGQQPAGQPPVDRSRLDRDKAGKPRTKRTNSSSQDHPSSKKRRTSDLDEGHTSARQRIRREPTDSNHSHPVYEEHGVVAKRQLEQHRVRPCGSRDSGLVMHDDDEDGEQPEHRQQHDLAADDISEQLQHLAPAQAAAAAAAASAKRFVKQQADPDGEAPARVKVFYAGLRWGLSLQPSAIKSRQLLAKALNDAYVGEIRSVGQGECLTAVFVDANGATAELGPVKWRGSSKANSSRWRALAKTAARIYVRGPEAPLP